MKHMLWIPALTLALAAAPAAAQTRVSVGFEVGAPLFADGVVVADPPYWHRHREVFVVPRPYFYRVPRGYYYRRHYWRRHRYWMDRDNDRWDGDGDRDDRW